MLAGFQREITTPQSCTEYLLARLVLNHDLGIGQTAANAIANDSFRTTQIRDSLGISNRFFDDDLDVSLVIDASSFASVAGGGRISLTQQLPLYLKWGRCDVRVDRLLLLDSF